MKRMMIVLMAAVLLPLIGCSPLESRREIRRRRFRGRL